MTTQGRNPYRGPFSYKEDDEDIFFGRNLEIEELVDLIRKNQLTILYGSSGTGKTSLIHAKLLPQLKREYFHPIYIRINFADNNEDPLHYIQKRIVEELRIWDENLPEFETGQTLIHYASKNVIFKGLIKPVLFFDQFEELFTLGAKNDPYKIHRFMFQLSELIELRLPDNLKTLTSINNISCFKVVFSLRQDWIGFLEDFSQLIPSINEARYHLKKFSSAQAMDAIICPSQNTITEETAKTIIKKIGTPALWKENNIALNYLDQDLINKEIDPFVLSLYCYQLYDICIERGHFQITTDFVLEHQDTELIRNYYEEKIDNYRDIKYLIEDKLLNESGKRLIIPFNKFADGKKDLEELTYNVANDTGIVRIIGVGIESEIEIVHDRLAHQIFESKNERIAHEIYEEATRKEQQAESLKQAAQKAKRTTFRIGIIAGIIIVLLTAFAIKIYINFKNDHTLLGLKDQLFYEKEKNLKAQDSINILNSLRQDINAGLAKIHSEAPGNSEEAFKAHDNLIRRQESLIDSVNTENSSLTATLNEKEQRIKSLESKQFTAEEKIRDLETKLNPGPQPTLVGPNTAIKDKFEKKDFSNLKILNDLNPDGSYDFNDIKTHGFKFSFDIAPVSDDEKGKIMIRVYYKVSRSNTSQEVDFKPIQTLETFKQPINYIMLVTKGDLKPGTASYEVKYFMDITNPKTSYILDEGNFKIRRPPSSSSQPSE